MGWMVSMQLLLHNHLQHPESSYLILPHSHSTVFIAGSSGLLAATYNLLDTSKLRNI